MLRPESFVSLFIHMEKTEYMLSKSESLSPRHCSQALLTFGEGQVLTVQSNSVH